MRIGILQCGHFPAELVPECGTYSDLYARMLDGHGFTFRTWSVVDQDFPTELDAVDGWLVTGSRHGTYEDLPWISPLEALIRRIRDGGQPLVGICFGHQIIAQALGGKVEKFAGGWSVGRTLYEIEGQRVALNAWHQDQVVELPPNARLAGTSELCANAALVYDGTIFTVQPHPEFEQREVEGLLRVRGAALPEPVKTSARAGLEQPLDTAAFGTRIARFFLDTRKAAAWSAA